MPEEAGPKAGELRSGNVTARSLDIAGPLLVSVRRFADARGAFVETYSRRDFAAIGIPDEFVQDNQSLSV
ncbi:dTDP-4-dehydrorhamnose 3,5-epimerase family protein, partial [Falsiroseomonas sp.]|uniref:dTDP-4-dehydrorhamnose 3,5-epimerase family protein n=1 Tax=Falsiroseomonas sp. TaxID=2870721 RepID=UPI002719C7F0